MSSPQTPGSVDGRGCPEANYRDAVESVRWISTPARSEGQESTETVFLLPLGEVNGLAKTNDLFPVREKAFGDEKIVRKPKSF
jgi:hypothetical protein